MKKFLLPALCWVLLLPAAALAQKKVNEKCSGTIDCLKGLFCVETVDGKKCAACDQSTLNRLTGDVNSKCKTFENSWSPDKSPEYQAVEAEDGRVAVEVFDDLLEKAKACKAARFTREKDCWEGGDPEHKKAIEQVESSIKRISEHKYTMIGDKRVYYCNLSTYTGKLRTFKSKTGSLNLSTIKGALESYQRKLKAKTKINCRQATDYKEDCETGLAAAKDLLNSCFKGSESVMPAEYLSVYTQCKQLAEDLDKVIDEANSKKLCE